MIALSDLLNETRLIYAERRDTLEAQRSALARGDKKARFTPEEVAKRAARLPKIEAIGRGLAALETRRAEVPEWILAAFEGAAEPPSGRRTPERGAAND